MASRSSYVAPIWGSVKIRRFTRLTLASRRRIRFRGTDSGCAGRPDRAGWAAETINSEVQLVFRKQTRGQVIGAELQEGFTHIGTAVSEAAHLAAEQLAPRVEAAREAAGPALEAARDAPRQAVAPKVAAALAVAAPAVTTAKDTIGPRVEAARDAAQRRPVLLQRRGRPRRPTGGAGLQEALQPPSITSELPVIDAAAGEHRKATASATSSGSISRLTDARASITRPMTSSSGSPWAFAWSAICPSTSGVRT